MRVARISDAEIEGRKRVLARYLAQRASCRGVVTVSLSSMTSDLDLTANELRCVINHLRNDGMMEVLHRSASNGAQIENAYWITARGMLFAGVEKS